MWVGWAWRVCGGGRGVGVVSGGRGGGGSGGVLRREII